MTPGRARVLGDEAHAESRVTSGTVDGVSIYNATVRQTGIDPQRVLDEGLQLLCDPPAIACGGGDDDDQPNTGGFVGGPA